MMHCIFDIETGPQPLDVLAKVMPEFEAPSNYKDAEKIAAALQAKREKWLADAALDATTGRVIAAGMLYAGGEINSFEVLHCEGDEAALLREFWNRMDNHHDVWSSGHIIGWNSASFDLPFIIRRSWLLGVAVPKWIREGRFWHHDFLDLLEVWRLGDRNASTGGLDRLARCFGLEGKTESLGANFAVTWEQDRPRAVSYLRRDVELTADLARRLGVL
jgi:predicted PolB exonuclease-like 3'-5' exonuclease